jgi:putative transposase
MTPPANAERYKNHRFPVEIISHGVWLYSRFSLSYRDVEELLFTRGGSVHMTQDTCGKQFLPSQF